MAPTIRTSCAASILRTGCCITGSTARCPRNNVLNPFTPFGDCSLIRMANLYANICHVGKRICGSVSTCSRKAGAADAASRLRLAIGKSAEIVVSKKDQPEEGQAEVAPPMLGDEARATDVLARAGRA